MDLDIRNSILSEDEQDALFRGVWAGTITVFDLPLDVYLKTVERLNNAIYRGFQVAKDIPFENPDFEKIEILKKQIFPFSSAKTFQQVRDYQNLLFDDDGFKRSFGDFKKGTERIPGAEDFYRTYNKNWLQAEYQTTIKYAQSAKEWRHIQEEKEEFPLLKYVTIGDERVRPLHANMDGIIRPVNDSFWNTRMPPNGFRCRCSVEQLEEGKISRIKGRDLDKDVPDKMFQNNVGKRGVMFKDHPYFNVPKEFEQLKKRNFDLPKP